MKIDTVYPSSHSVSRRVLNSSSSSRIMIGKYLSYESWGMLKFTLPDSLANVSIRTAQITLRASYYFLNSAVSLMFDVYPAARNWQGDSLTLDSLNGGTYHNQSNLLSQVNVVGDTDYVKFSISDTALVRSWFANIPDTSQMNNGVVLRPTSNVVIKGFASFSSLNPEGFRPKLTVQYTKSAGDTGTVDIFSGSSRFVADIPYANLVQNPERIYVQAGVAYNGYVNFISTNPVPSKASIHKAELELVLDQSSSRLNTLTIDSLVTFYVGTSGLDPSIPPVLSDTSLSSGQKVYRFQIQQYVQRWVRGATGSVALVTYSPIEVLDLFSFYGENSSKALRPKIIVTYSPTR